MASATPSPVTSAAAGRTTADPPNGVAVLPAVYLPSGPTANVVAVPVGGPPAIRTAGCTAAPTRNRASPASYTPVATSTTPANRMRPSGWTTTSVAASPFAPPR